MDNVKIEDLVDSDIEFIEKDSGMSSLGGSKDDTPERRAEPISEALTESTEEEKATSSGTTSTAPTSVVEKESKLATAPTAATTTTTTTVATKDAENYDDEPDETLAERLIGLTEMFPDCVRNFTESFVDHTNSTIKTLYKFSCNASWVFFTSSIILFAPVIFETERAQMEEMQKTQQKQVLLGPGSAMAVAGPTPPAMPSMR